MDIESLLFNKIRLAILVLLSSNGEMSYKSLKKVVNTTDGNLATHLRKLEDAGLVAYKKIFEGRRPKTIYRITPEGERELSKFVSNLKNLLEKYEGGR